ncbi:hypothetical protein FHS94_000982 [Sphingomonas aerophila]|uniref:Uncharacterized protein n=1 Tax=Sphingomonas aerophila TaxID=1344948 RepID=A0A7W9BBG8_9SPHN|nr:hypothetical protein [Sphingomonas aerophila]
MSARCTGAVSVTSTNVRSFLGLPWLNQVAPWLPLPSRTPSGVAPLPALIHQPLGIRQIDRNLTPQVWTAKALTLSVFLRGIVPIDSR